MSLLRAGYSSLAVPLSQMQAPAPLQFMAPGHSLSGSVPLGTKLQTPGNPPFFTPLADLHNSVQAVLLQTESMQKPLAHCVLVVQAFPFAFCTVQALGLPTQKKPGSTAHVLEHPSELIRLPSSHVSGDSTTPFAHTAVPTVTVTV